MKLRLELTKDDLVKLIRARFAEMIADDTIVELEDKIVIETKSKQNYRSEWETADFRAYLEINK